MSDLQNPLFDEEKEFLERKKLEYERALRGDVEQIKEKSVKVGKVAAIGAGLAGGIWLITKAFGSKKRKRSRYADDGERNEFEADNYEGHDYEHDHAARRDFGPNSEQHDDFDDENDEEFGAEYYTAGNGKRYRSVVHRKSAAVSATAFTEQREQGHEADDLGFGATAGALQQPQYREESAGNHLGAQHREHASSAFDSEEFQDDPFEDLPYDDSRRLPASQAFEGANGQAPNPAVRRSNMVGAVLKAFLQTDTGKVIVGQVAAVAMALVTKKVSEFFPSDKNPDLATSPGYAPAETGFTPAVSLASPDSPDASTHPSSI